MYKNKEQTLGAKLQRLQSLIEYLTGLVVYNNSNPECSINGLQNLATAIGNANDSEALQTVRHRMSVEKRVFDFAGGEFSLEKLLTYIRSAVAAEHGEQSKAYEIIGGTISNMRPPKGKKKKDEENEEDEEEVDADTIGDAVDADATDADTKEPKKVSQSHRSYASLAASFRRLVQQLGGIDYNPNKPELEIPQLQAFAAQLADRNHQTERELRALDTVRLDRDALYAQISDRVQRVKNYVRVQFGSNSTAYLGIKGL